MVHGPLGFSRRPLIGPLRIEAGAFCDDTGSRLPVLCHAGDLLALYVRDPSWAEVELDTIAATGYLGVRTWTWLDGPYWEGLGRTITPEEAGYWGAVDRFAGALRVRGLRWLVSQGDMLRYAWDRRAFMHQLAETLRDAGGLQIVCGVDGGNESWKNGESDPIRLREAVDAFRIVLDVPIWSLTSPSDEKPADLDRYSGSVYDVHGYRGDHVADKIRHAFSIPFEGKPACRLGIQSEPPGPGAIEESGLVSSMGHWGEMDAEAMALLTAMHLMARQMSVYFSSPGVSCRERGEFSRQPGFRESAVIASVLPPDLMRFQTLCHGGDSQRGRRVLCATGKDDYLIRADHAIHDDGRFVIIAYAATPGDWVVGLKIERGCELTTIHPVTRDTFGPTRYWSDDTLGLHFRHGRIITGRLL